MSVHRSVLVAYLALALVAQPLAGPDPASAQIMESPQSVGIWLSVDGGRPELAGQIFREGSDPERYVEHWVLYANYIYPSTDNGAVVTLKPGYHGYGSAAEFLATVPFEAGARYVKVDCLDQKTSPLTDPPNPDKVGKTRAQIPVDPDSVGIWLTLGRGEPVLAGQIYREGSDAEHYVEHWVLYPSYVYPSPENGAVVTLEPGLQRYESAEDFLTRVPFERGARYVEADCLDGRSIPGR